MTKTFSELGQGYPFAAQADDDDLENRVSLCGNSYSKVKIYVCFIINCGLVLDSCHLP